MTLSTPVIGITVWRRHVPTSLGEATDLFTLGTEYVSALTPVGVTPVLLPGVAGIEEMVEELDGLLLSGGEDVHPSRYSHAEQSGQTYDPDRDRAEIALYQRAKQKGLPVLAICRGLQLVAVAEGGTLIPDIPTTQDHPLQVSPEDYVGARHRIRIEDDSELARIYGTTTRLVNTIHHQAVDRVPPNARVTARSDDGIIEALEIPEARVIAVQWHPEKMTEPGEKVIEERLFRDFAERSRLFHLNRTTHQSERTTP